MFIQNYNNNFIFFNNDTLADSNNNSQINESFNKVYSTQQDNAQLLQLSVSSTSCSSFTQMTSFASPSPLVLTSSMSNINSNFCQSNDLHTFKNELDDNNIKHFKTVDLMEHLKANDEHLK